MTCFFFFLACFGYVKDQKQIYQNYALKIDKIDTLAKDYQQLLESANERVLLQDPS